MRAVTKPHPMNNEIALLAQFLDSLGPEVSGHSASPLSETEAQRIREFAAGRLSPAERQDLLPTLLGNEAALRALVSNLRDES